MNIIVNEVTCPVCRAKELHTDGKLQIRTNKFFAEEHWWSQCLICSGGYDEVDGTFIEENHDPHKGWF